MRPLFIFLVISTAACSKAPESNVPQPLEVPDATLPDGSDCHDEMSRPSLEAWLGLHDFVAIGTIDEVRPDLAMYVGESSGYREAELGECVPERTSLGLTLTLGDITVLTGDDVESLDFTVPGWQIRHWSSSPVTLVDGTQFGDEAPPNAAPSDGSLTWTNPTQGLAPGERVFVAVVSAEDGTLTTAGVPIGTFEPELSLQTTQHLERCVEIPSELRGTESELVADLRARTAEAPTSPLPVPASWEAHSICVAQTAGPKPSADVGVE